MFTAYMIVIYEQNIKFPGFVCEQANDRIQHLKLRMENDHGQMVSHP